MSEPEREAVNAFTSEAAMYHRMIRGEELPPMTNERFMELACHARNIGAAAKAYRLRRPLTLYAGYSSGYSALGYLWGNSPEQLEDLKLEYGGVFSSTTNRATAIGFMEKSTFTRRVLLTIEASPGFFGLPAGELGLGHGIEEEVIVASQPLIVTSARRYPSGPNTVHETLELYVRNGSVIEEQSESSLPAKS
ncbi:MAG: hypothetical protein KGO53_03935 [Alphaproteobacteria bacterium]|nr:hypothetical protein [Alphaproteobacteria bacterium]